MLTLGDLHIGQDAIIRVVGGEGELRHHLLDMGLTPGTEVTLRKTAPALASWTKPPATTSAKPAPPLPPVHR